jgi:hypothetical protein
MPKFLGITSQTVALSAKRSSSGDRCVTLQTRKVRVHDNAQLELYINHLDRAGLVALDIQLIEGEEGRWTDENLQMPNLTRFTYLEKVCIEFGGAITTTAGSGCLKLPNKVWMFALRNGTLMSELRFGYRNHQLETAIWICLLLRGVNVAAPGFNPRSITLPSACVNNICSFWGGFSTDPCAILALFNARVFGHIGWQTMRGINRNDMTLMMRSIRLSDLSCIPTFVYQGRLKSVTARGGFDSRGKDYSSIMRAAYGDLGEYIISEEPYRMECIENAITEYCQQTASWFNPIDEIDRFFAR